MEWDTLICLLWRRCCVSAALGHFIGYLDALSSVRLYGDARARPAANILVGLASAVVDNIPVMFAMRPCDPHMSHGQWLLVTLTAGVGGSCLSVGSAAGVALMGQAKGVYTFMTHLKLVAGHPAGIPGVHRHALPAECRSLLKARV